MTSCRGDICWRYISRKGAAAPPSADPTLKNQKLNVKCSSIWKGYYQNLLIIKHCHIVRNHFRLLSEAPLFGQT